MGRWSLVCSLALVCACQVQLKPVELDPEPEPDDRILLYEQKDVDILFVIDNSGSMGAEQAKLAASFGAFIEVLEQADVRANYRIGVTTTDNGNPFCGATTPEAGKLVLSSCRERLEDFVYLDVDARELACNDICTLDAAALAITPSKTELNPEPAPRPWLERIEGHQNIPATTSTVDAFRCFGPQGINGCGFESPLESMLLALSRSDAPEEPEYGFMRQSAVLAVVFVTDEVDCSYNKDYSGIFTGEQGTVFWSDPDAMWPSSALCWNAGVECFGDPSGYDSCEPVDRGVEGQPVANPELAVLHPLGRYAARLDAIEQEKRLYSLSGQIIVGLIGGVQLDGSLFYADVGESDPEFQLESGIGPGCTGPLGEAALPPVRLRELTERYTADNLHSICATDFTGALTTIADAIRTELVLACAGRCVADIDPETELIDPLCEVEQAVPGVGVRAVPECVRGDGGAYLVDAASGSYVLPSDAELCFATLTDHAGLTPGTLDDIAPYCSEQGANLEFQLAYAAGVVPPSGATSRATCAISADPERDCPQL
jgi:hypothetical protein